MSGRPVLSAEELAYSEKAILVCRRNLRNFLVGFYSAQTLFEHLKAAAPPFVPDPMSFTQWRVIAARDAALGVYHFRCSLDTLREHLGKATSVVADRIAIRDASKELDKVFPNSTNIRHVVAHAGESEREADQYDFISAVRERVGPKFRVTGGPLECLSDHHYFIGGRDKKVFYLEVSKASFDALDHIHTKISDSFAQRNI